MKKETQQEYLSTKSAQDVMPRRTTRKQISSEYPENCTDEQLRKWTSDVLFLGPANILTKIYVKTSSVSGIAFRYLMNVAWVHE